MYRMAVAHAGVFARPSVWSTALFIVPLVGAYYVGLYAHAVMLTTVVFASFAYHLSDQQRFRSVDMVCAWTVILLNVYVAYKGAFAQPYFSLALLSFVASMYFRYWREKRGGEYEINHALWHASGVFITIFSILTYAAHKQLL